MIKKNLLLPVIFGVFSNLLGFDSVSELGIFLNPIKEPAPADSVFPTKPDYSLFPHKKRDVVPKRDVLKTLNHFCNSEISRRQEVSFMGDCSSSLFGQKEFIRSCDQVAIWGDIHGSIDSIYKSLTYLCKKGFMDDHFYIKSKNFKMIFLGDYVDRGVDGIEVLLVLAQLKIKNPDQVFILRGNHEDLNMNRHGGFKKELEGKYGYSSKDILEAIDSFYDQLPVVMFLGFSNSSNGTDFIQLCHGGIEIGYNPKEFLNSDYSYQLIKLIDRSYYIKILPIAMQRLIESKVAREECLRFEARGITNPYNLGLCWSDFTTLGSDKLDFSFGRGFIFGKSLTLHYLNNASSLDSKLKMIIRGHQHYGQMLEDLIRTKGFFRIWQDTVITLCSAPVGSFKYSSFVVMKLNEKRNVEFEHVVL